MNGYWNIVRKVETNEYLIILCDRMKRIVIVISRERLEQTNNG